MLERRMLFSCFWYLSASERMDVDSKLTDSEAVAETVVGHQRWMSAFRQEGAPILLERANIAKYELIYRLGSGGMATVYVARLSGLAGFERLVAVKAIHQHLADSKKFVDMFLDEARVAAAIHHPNVAEIYDVGKDKDQFFMVGEFVHGHDLGKLLRRAEERQKPLSQGLLAQIGAQICFGLHAAHQTRDKNGKPLNLIHRDVSPNNILISYNGFVKIIDFGVAWASNRLAHTESGALKGKIGYVAPEQITGQPLDRRSDIFSAGVIQYIMATMTHPFPGSSDAERLHRIVTGDIVPPREINPDVHPELERIVLKAMSTSPADRYDSAAQMGQDLEAFAESTGAEIKSETLSSLMFELFESELLDHQSSLNLYRETKQREREEASGFVGDIMDTGSFPLPQDTLTDVLKPVETAVKRATHRNMWIMSVLTVFVLILAIAVVFLYKAQAESQRRNEEAMPERYVDRTSKSVGNPMQDNESVPSKAEPAASPAPVPESQPSVTNGEPPPAVMDQGPQAAPQKKPAIWRKRKPEKKPGQGLINNPY